MSTDAVNDFAGFLLALTAVPAIATAIIYGFGAPWWTSWLGRVIFSKWLAVALVFVFILSRRWFGDYPGYEWIAVAVYGFTLVTFTATTIEVIVERTAPEDGALVPVTKEKKMVNNPNATPALVVPDIWYKAQRVLRTVVAFLVVAIPTVNLAALALIDYLQNQEDVAIPGWVFLVLNGIVAATALIIGIVTRLMAVPGVNAWLTKLGLGSVPREALQPEVKPSGKIVTAVKPDPKAETEAVG